MASKSAQQEPEKAEVIEEALDILDKALDRVKVLYEQYFLGIQKQAPSFLHTDVERKLRDLSQMQIRNTALRYRLTTLQQKYGAYSTYWRRTIKQIENGTYARNLSKVGRKAVRTGEAVPEEILAAMPKRMREQVVRDRDLARAIAARRGDVEFEDEAGTTPFISDDMIAMISESTDLRRNLRKPGNVHQLDMEDVDVDLNEFFAEVERQTPTADAPASEAVSITFKSGGTPQLFGGDAARSAGAKDDAAGARSALETAATLWGDAASIVPEPGRAPTVPVRVPDDVEPGRAPTVPVRAPNLGEWSSALGRASAGSPPREQATPTTPTSALPREQATPTTPTTALPPVVSRAPAVYPPLPTPRPGAPRSDDSGVRKLDDAALRAMPAVPPIPKPPSIPPAPSQLTKPNPIAPGSAAARAATPVETMAGPFPRVGPRPGDAAGREPSAAARSPVPGSIGREPSAGVRAATPDPASRDAAARSALPEAIGREASGAMRAAVPAPTSREPVAARSAVPESIGREASAGARAAMPEPAAAARSAVPDPIRREAAMPEPGRSSEPGREPIARVPEPSAAARSAMLGARVPPRVDPSRSRAAPAPPAATAQPAADLDGGWTESDATSPRVGGPRPEPAPRAEAPRPRVERKTRPAEAPRLSPPPGMTDADVNALFANYVKAKEMVGESAGPGSYGKLLKTINAQAPKIMQQYNAKGVDFSIVVKDNQVIIRAKPKT